MSDTDNTATTTSGESPDPSSEATPPPAAPALQADPALIIESFRGSASPAEDTTTPASESDH